MKAVMVCTDEMDTSYLDNLDEYINDEGRIVTYKWLSLTLGVHSNVAKQMLHHFVTQQRGDGGGGGGGGLTLTYLLTGVVEEGDADVRKVVKVVREAELEAARAAMNTVSSLHVYSVQKSVLPDIGLLYGADYDVTKQHLTSTSRYSGIRCSEAQVSPSTGRLEHIVKEMPTPPNKSVPKTYEKKEDKKQDPKLGNTTTTTTNSTTATSATTATTNAATKPTSQIASMFAKQTKKLESSSSTAVKEEKAPAKAKSAGISAFFTKGRVQRSPDTTKSSIPTTAVKSENTPCPDESKESLPTEDAQSDPKGKEDCPVYGVEQEEDKEEVKSGGTSAGNTKAAKSKTTVSASSSASKKKRKSKGKKDEPKTKRTRIMQLSDSESDEEEDRDEEEDERLLLLPSPPPPVRVNSDSEEEKEEKNVVVSKQPEEEAKVGMRKKMVDDTYMDDNGYLVTKKVMKLVPLTEEEIKQEKLEEEERKKKEETRRIKEEEEKEKKSSPTVKSETSPSSSGQKKKKKGGKEDNKKQANIMSFFAKK